VSGPKIVAGCAINVLTALVHCIAYAETAVCQREIGRAEARPCGGTCFRRSKALLYHLYAIESVICDKHHVDAR
jgi:hypothetical protein